MTGLALKLFEEKRCKAALHVGSFLENLVDAYDLSTVDLEFAKSILKQCRIEQDSVTAFIFYLSLAVRNGHLMVKIEKDQVLPKVSSLLRNEQPLTEADLNNLEKLVFDGALELQNNEIFNTLFSSYLRKFENCIYFQRYFHFETTILEHLIRIQSSSPKLKINEDFIHEEIESLLEKKLLLKPQADAILQATNNCLTLISGGPGTGKTYTAAELLKILIAATDLKILVAAPTGKAAANLQKALKGDLKATTLHQLLGVKENGQLKRDSPAVLSADLILIDESSMIDAFMMGRLLSLVKSGARIIFLGDPYQLPSVDAGAIFSDMLKIFPEHLVTLQTCLRAELEELVSFGQAINAGNASQVFEMLKMGNAVKRLELEEHEMFLQYVEKHFFIHVKINQDPQEILEAFNNFRILCPLRKGPFGVDALNRELFLRMVKKHSRQEIMAVPIMLLRNDPKLELFNGEVGVLVLHNSREKHFEDFSLKSGDYALFPCKEKGYRMLPAFILPNFEYAYCLSVHKAQGSEFNQVLCLLPEGSEHFGREVLYTAVTRAKKQLEIFGSDEVLLKTIQNKNERLSGLARRIENKSLEVE